jgi:hypothetical protein
MTGGPAALTRIRDGFTRWGDDHGYASISDIRGAASLAKSTDRDAFERANYIQALRSAAAIPAQPRRTPDGFPAVT